MANGNARTRKAARTATAPAGDLIAGAYPRYDEFGREHVRARIDKGRADAIRKAAKERGITVEEWIMQAICIALHDHHRRSWEPDAVWTDTPFIQPAAGGCRDGSEEQDS